MTATITSKYRIPYVALRMMLIAAGTAFFLEIICGSIEYNQTNPLNIFYKILLALVILAALLTSQIMAAPPKKVSISAGHILVFITQTAGKLLSLIIKLKR